MKLYAQQGHGTGEKINDGLERGWIDGAILSPKDNRLEKIESHLAHIQTNYPNADRMFDPQFYVTLLALVDGARLGKLTGEDYPYFEARRRGQLESENQIRHDLEAVLRFQANLAVTHVIAPNIVIPQAFNSAEAVIAKNFVRNTRSIWSGVGDDRPVYATLAIGADALRDRQELEEFLTDITLLDEPLDGFYLLIRQESSAATEQLIDSRSLAGWMLLNYSLKLNGFEVVNGFSDILTPFLCAAGGDAGATGWYSNLKCFALDRFEPAIPGGQQPIPRYLSYGLLNSIRFDELQRLRGRLPDVLNNLESDFFYRESNGSRPDNRTEEMLQTWDAIGHLNGQLTEGDNVGNLRVCGQMVERARRLYAQINAPGGLPLPGRSNEDHLDPLRYGIQMFADLAEINLSGNQ